MTAELPAGALDTLLPLAQKGDWKALAEACAAQLGQTADSLYLQALAAFTEEDLAGAARLAKQALDTGDEFAECADFVAVVCGLASDLNTALYYAKLSLALPARPHLHPFRPQDLPDLAAVFKGVEDKPLLERAKLALACGQLDVMERLLQQHLAFFPSDEEAMLLAGVCLALQGDPLAAADWLRGCIHRAPASALLLSALGLELGECGMFSEACAVHERAIRVAPTDAVVHARLLTDLADSATASPEELARLVKRWGESFSVEQRGDTGGLSGQDGKLAVGIVLSDLPGTPAGSFLADMLSRANPTEFRIVAYGYGTLTDVNNMEFQKAVHDWYDLTELDAETIADMFMAEDLDVLIDTGGFASPLPLAAVGAGAARRQVLWRNAPYGAGLRTTDAILCDDVVDAAYSALLPPGCSRIRLAHGATLAGLPPAQAQLAEVRQGEGVVFGADVPLRQLTAETAAWWAEALLAAPDSMLLLRDHGYRKPAALARLTALFGNFGVAHRIDLVPEADEAAFWSQADIALLPPVVARPQQVLNVLWTGVPALVSLPPGRHGRDTASLLHHAGLAELVAADISDFAQKAVAWARDGDGRQRFRDSIRERLSASPVFDPQLRAKDLWQGCRQLFQ